MSAAVGDAYLVVLRGEAGVGKTALLRALAERGEPVLDLEGLAGHRGSAFGGVGLPQQPTAQEFDSRIAAVLHQVRGRAPIFVEAEGAAIGRLATPPNLLRRIGSADYILLRASLAARVARIAATYSSAPRAEVIAAIARVASLVGASAAQQAQSALLRGDVEGAVKALLPYYDRAYAHQLAACQGCRLAVLDQDDEGAEDLPGRCLALVTGR